MEKGTKTPRARRTEDFTLELSEPIKFGEGEVKRLLFVPMTADHLWDLDRGDSHRVKQALLLAGRLAGYTSEPDIRAVIGELAPADSNVVLDLVDTDAGEMNVGMETTEWATGTRFDRPVGFHLEHPIKYGAETLERLELHPIRAGMLWDTHESGTRVGDSLQVAAAQAKQPESILRRLSAYDTGRLSRVTDLFLGAFRSTGKRPSGS